MITNLDHCTSCGRPLEALSKGTFVSMMNRSDRRYNQSFIICENCAGSLLEFIGNRGYSRLRSSYIENEQRMEAYKRLMEIQTQNTNEALRQLMEGITNVHNWSDDNATDSES